MMGNRTYESSQKAPLTSIPPNHPISSTLSIQGGVKPEGPLESPIRGENDMDPSTPSEVLYQFGGRMGGMEEMVE